MLHVWLHHGLGRAALMPKANAVFESYTWSSVQCTEENRTLTSLVEVKTCWTHVVIMLSIDEFCKEGEIRGHK